MLLIHVSGGHNYTVNSFDHWEMSSWLRGVIYEHMTQYRDPCCETIQLKLKNMVSFNECYLPFGNDMSYGHDGDLDYDFFT